MTKKRQRELKATAASDGLSGDACEDYYEMLQAITDFRHEVKRLREVARLAAEYIADESAGSMEFWRAYEPGEHY